MSAFNFLLAWMNIERMHMYMYADERESKQVSIELQRGVTVNALFDQFKWAKIDTSHVKRMPFRRMATTPFLGKSPKGDTPRKKNRKRSAFGFKKDDIDDDTDIGFNSDSDF